MINRREGERVGWLEGIKLMIIIIKMRRKTDEKSKKQKGPKELWKSVNK